MEAGNPIGILKRFDMYWAGMCLEVPLKLFLLPNPLMLGAVTSWKVMIVVSLFSETS